jgi:uncharacterized membrane protein YoaK (UPF0700 family)
MRKKLAPRNWLGYAALALAIFGAAAAGGWISMKYASPCVCLVVQKVGTLN